MIDFKEIKSDSQIMEIIDQSVQPTIIVLCQKNSFGKMWVSKLLKEVKKEYQNKIKLQTFFVEYPPRVTIYLIKDKEVKTHLQGSISQKIFKEKLKCITK